MPPGRRDVTLRWARGGAASSTIAPGRHNGDAMATSCLVGGTSWSKDVFGAGWRRHMRWMSEKPDPTPNPASEQRAEPQIPVSPPAQAVVPSDGLSPQEAAKHLPPEIGGPKGPEPTRYGDWEQKGRVTDF